MGFVLVENILKIMFFYGNGIYLGYFNLGMFFYLYFVFLMIFFFRFGRDGYC